MHSDKRVLIDLDGPILDVRPRYIRAHEDVIRSFGGTPLSMDEYWSLKRNRVGETTIFERCGLDRATASRATQQRLQLIETKEYVQHDDVWPWAAEALSALRLVGAIMVVTQRHHESLVRWQLERFALGDSIDALLCGRGDDTLTAKARHIREAGVMVPAGSVLIGDTEVDVCSGKELGCVTVALGSGIRTREHLLAYDPDVFVDTLADVPSWLQSRR
jgi:phosphoglycolate phosphatase